MLARGTTHNGGVWTTEVLSCDEGDDEDGYNPSSKLSSESFSTCSTPSSIPDSTSSSSSNTRSADAYGHSKLTVSFRFLATNLSSTTSAIAFDVLRPVVLLMLVGRFAGEPAMAAASGALTIVEFTGVAFAEGISQSLEILLPASKASQITRTIQATITLALMAAAVVASLWFFCGSAFFHAVFSDEMLAVRAALFLRVASLSAFPIFVSESLQITLFAVNNGLGALCASAMGFLVQNAALVAMFLLKPVSKDTDEETALRTSMTQIAYIFVAGKFFLFFAQLVAVRRSWLQGRFRTSTVGEHVAADAEAGVPAQVYVIVECEMSDIEFSHQEPDRTTNETSSNTSLTETGATESTATVIKSEACLPSMWYCGKRAMLVSLPCLLALMPERAVDEVCSYVAAALATTTAAPSLSVESAVAAFAVVASLIQICSLFSIGLATTLSLAMSRHRDLSCQHARFNLQQQKTALIRVLTLFLAGVLVLVAVFASIPHLFVEAFLEEDSNGSDEASHARELGVSLVRQFALCCLPLYVLQVTLAGGLRGLGKQTHTVFVAFVSFLVITPILVVTLAWKAGMLLQGLVWALFGGYLSASVFFAALLWLHFRVADKQLRVSFHGTGGNLAGTPTDWNGHDTGQAHAAGDFATEP
ncbi:MAG: hypothetical protein MHM6MM_005001 [Cercozoa sp. M6MM]